MIPLPNARAVLRLMIAGIVLLLTYQTATARWADKVHDAYAREAHYRRLYVEVVEQTDKAMSRLMASDYYLHDTITTALPHWHDTRMVARAILAGDG